MKYLLLALILGAIFGTLKTRARLRRMKSPQERALAVRMALFSATLAALFLLALVILPNKPRILLLIPMLLAGSGVARLWRAAQLRARRDEENRVDFERMKRVN